MAITPWSWTASNGSATATQTRNAYQAITTGGMTYSFSRTVWNDLIDKIGETADALGRGWISEYLSKYSTKMHILFAPLTARMFNSARYNTGYQSWTWSYDPTATGYVGRDDFQGVTQAGENDADFVYGAYIVELTKRLNTVIGIINGTGACVEMQETIGCFLENAAEIITASPQGMSAGADFTISHSGALEQEKQRSWVLHFRVSMPTHRATLEIGNYSFMEASLWTNMRIEKAIRTDPSEPMTVHYYFPQVFKTEHSVLPSSPFTGNLVDAVTLNTDITLRRPQLFGAGFIGSAYSADRMNQLAPIAFTGSTPIRLHQSGVMMTEQMGLFASQITIRNYYKAKMNAGHSAACSRLLDMNLHITKTAHTGYAAIMEKDLSYLLSIVSDANVPKSAAAEYVGNYLLSIRKDANIAHSAAAASEIPMVLTTTQKLNRYHSKLFAHSQSESIQHFGEMMLQQIGFFLIDYRIGYSTRAKITKLGAFPLVIEHTDAIDSSATFSLEVMNPIVEHFIQPTAHYALLQSEDLPSMYVSSVNPVTWSMEFSFRKPHTLIAGGRQKLSSQTEPVLLPPNMATAEDSTVVTPDAHGEAKMLKPILGSVLERFLTSGNAKVGYTHRFGGSTGGVIRIDNSEMSCARGALDLNAQADSVSGSSGTIIQISPQQFAAESANGHSYHAELGLVQYAYVSAACANVLAIKAELETNGEWIYPAQDGKNLYVVQVYETDKFTEAAFFDFGRFKGNGVLISGVARAEVNWIYRCDAESGVGFAITPNAELNFVNAATWEYPVQNGTDLTITQVGYMKLHQHKLEVK